MTLIKICGIKTPEMATLCATAGAHYVGLVFCQQSLRYVTVPQAKQIASAAIASGIIPVGVFTDLDAQSMIDICTITGLSHVQLHGEKSKENAFALPAHFHKIYVNPTRAVIQQLRPTHDFALLDSDNPGTGQVMDWQHLQTPVNLRFFLAGGLTADNVQHAIALTQPFAVDVSSGVESTHGEKSTALIQQFITKVGEATHGS